MPVSTADVWTDQHLQAVVHRFRIEGRCVRVVPCGNGHIHDTFRVETDGAGPAYLLQRINRRVFPDVPLLMRNLERVTRHLQGKATATGANGASERGLTLIPTQDDAYVYRDDAGEFWRLFVFLEGTRTYDVAPRPELLHESGRAFGTFLTRLRDFPPERVEAVLPDFHNLEKRLQALFDVAERDPAQRTASATAEIELVKSSAPDLLQLERRAQNGAFPLRVTHNDTKLNNVLFDQRDRAVCVIDLDTVMPGYVYYDFGDAIRTGANAVAEDEPDLSRVRLDLAAFEAFTRGFLAPTRVWLTASEIESLAAAPGVMTFTIGVRFLTDYLAGDRYFKTAEPEHNLRRARVQFRLLQSLDEHAAEMARLIERYACP